MNLPEYAVFETAALSSPEGESVERAVIERAFQLKHLKCITRGPRKRRIDFAGFSPFPNGETLDLGLFEWAVTIQAVETFRRYEYFRTSGHWPTFWAENPLTGTLKETARKIGVCVGIAVRIWNDLVSEWPDLSDHFRDFFEFYVVFQNTRRKLKKSTGPELAELVVTEIATAIPGRAGEILGPESPLTQLLLACDVDEKSVENLGRIQKRWSAISSRWNEWIALILNRDDRDWRYFPRFLWGVIGSTRLGVIVVRLHRAGVCFETAPELSAPGSFDVRYLYENRSLRIIPRITLKSELSQNDLTPDLIVAHEVGHMVVNFRWKLELCLADFIIEQYATRDRSVDVVRLMNLKRNAYRRMVDFHSAIETAADEMAVQILFPEDEIKELYESCLERDGAFSWIRFFPRAQHMLGIPRDSPHWERFQNIILDWTPAPAWHTRALISGKAVRAARMKVSSRRIDALLDQFWMEMASAIKTAPAGS